MDKEITSTNNDEHIGYSQIIDPVSYNSQVSNQHLYMAQADQFLGEKISAYAGNRNTEIVELGSGPGRIIPLLRSSAPKATITAVEVDPVFLRYCEPFAQNNFINLVLSDVENYKHPRTVDLFVSHGLHHHVTKGKKTSTYLTNIRDALKPDGRYILVDEFLPPYCTEQERELRTIIWHAHIIAHAVRKGFTELSIEEAKILIDDVQEGRGTAWFKNFTHVEYVLSFVESIDSAARAGKMDEAEGHVSKFLEGLEKLTTSLPTGDKTLDLSRHDYKICLPSLIQEIEENGLELEDVKAFGKLDKIGAVTVCTLKKA